MSEFVFKVCFVFVETFSFKVTFYRIFFLWDSLEKRFGCCEFVMGNYINFKLNKQKYKQIFKSSSYIKKKIVENFNFALNFKK